MTGKRASGILLHISSLPGDYGIGTLGKEAYRFVDFLESAGQTYWQILPVCPVGKGNSPYHSFSSFAGNAAFIDPDDLHDLGYLTEDELAAAKSDSDPLKVDFDAVKASRDTLFAAVFPRFIAAPPSDFEDFCRENADWLDDYALFMSIREHKGDLPLQKWEADIRSHRPKTVAMWKVKCAERVRYHQMLQYLFFRQWNALKAYANAHGVYIIGDLPIYVAPDSADVWADAHLFELDADGQPSLVAGCPPDAFSEDGQLWGNPVYDWKAIRLSGYRWWLRRLEAGLALYDIIRIDHFRGFESYYTIPADAETAREGEWKKGPGMKLWRAVEKQLGHVPIIAEDLGFLTPAVYKLVRDSGFPGMKVLQFAFDPSGDSEYLPHRYDKNCVVYTGTHDNDTILGWADSADEDELTFAMDYLHATDRDSLRKNMMRAALASVANTCILTAQDVCGLGNEARMNVPSTVGDNWSWRLTADALTTQATDWLRENTRLYGRLLNKENPNE